MNTTEKPLVCKEYLLQKSECKCGWTYTEMPEVPQDKHSPCGWVKSEAVLTVLSSKTII